jgi:hypothetical protein
MYLSNDWASRASNQARLAKARDRQLQHSRATVSDQNIDYEPQGSLEPTALTNTSNVDRVRSRYPRRPVVSMPS